MRLKRNNVILPTDMDEECKDICELLNSLPTVKTFESCCGHLRHRFSVWFFCDSIDVLTRLGRATERNYSDGRWEVVVVSTDSHPYGVFWLRSRGGPFETNEELETSLNGLMNSIRHWCEDEFDSHFAKQAEPETIVASAYSANEDGVKIEYSLPHGPWEKGYQPSGVQAEPELNTDLTRTSYEEDLEKEQ